MNLFTYLWRMARWQRLPVLPHTYSSEYDAQLVDEDVQQLMMLSHVRSPQSARLLERRHRKSARELIDELPARKRKRNIPARVMALVHRAFGTTPYNPTKSIALKHMRRGRR